MLLHEWEDFSWPIRYFVQKFPRTRVSERELTIERMRSSLRLLQTVPPPNHSPHDFLSLSGLLGLNLAPPSFGDHLESYDHNDTHSSVLSGHGVAPQARSILVNNEIDILITKTIFRVMRQYYTAIIVAVGHNVGVTLAISFGSRESIKLYDTFYQVFDREFGIKLNDYILGSDQELALKAVGPRHVLKSLHTKDCGRYASLVENLISTRSEKELRVLQSLCTRFCYNLRETWE
jgi:hypothetical protein